MSNNNTPTIFTFQNQAVREITDANGNPWFVARDVCDILGLDHITNALAKIPESHLTVIGLQSGGQVREMKVVDEPGLYRLVLRSDKPQAELFMEWVTSEVLPSIRRTGSYARPGVSAGYQDHAMTDLIGKLTRAVIRIESGMLEKAIERAHGGKSKINYDLTHISQFVASCCTESEHDLVAKRELHERYRQWCAELRMKPYGYNVFFQALDQSPVKTAGEFLRPPNSRRMVPVIRGLAVKSGEVLS